MCLVRSSSCIKESKVNIIVSEEIYSWFILFERKVILAELSQV